MSGPVLAFRFTLNPKSHPLTELPDRATPFSASVWLSPWTDPRAAAERSAAPRLELPSGSWHDAGADHRRRGGVHIAGRRLTAPGLPPRQAGESSAGRQGLHPTGNPTGSFWEVWNQKGIFLGTSKGRRAGTHFRSGNKGGAFLIRTPVQITIPNWEKLHAAPLPYIILACPQTEHVWAKVC